MSCISTNPSKRRSYLLQCRFIILGLFVQVPLEDGLVESQVLCFVTKDYCVGRPSVPKLPEQFAFLDPLTHFHQVVDPRNLGHPDFHDADASDFGVVCFDHVDLPGGHHGEQGL